MVVRDPAIERLVRTNGHPLRRNNYEVAEMYDCYRDGMSLATVARLYGRTRQAVYDVFRSRGYKLRSKKMVGARMIGGVMYTPDAQGYLRGTVDGRRVYAHKVAWEKANGRPIPDTHVVHFRDGNKENVDPPNLELVPKSEMGARFNSEGHNQFNTEKHGHSKQEKKERDNEQDQEPQD